ncbi:MAG TPA: hypothetical protein VGC45_11920 [Gryllotalpicola sp.]
MSTEQKGGAFDGIARARTRVIWWALLPYVVVLVASGCWVVVDVLRARSSHELGGFGLSAAIGVFVAALVIWALVGRVGLLSAAAVRRAAAEHPYAAVFQGQSSRHTMHPLGALGHLSGKVPVSYVASLGTDGLELRPRLKKAPPFARVPRQAVAGVAAGQLRVTATDYGRSANEADFLALVVTLTNGATIPLALLSPRGLGRATAADADAILADAQRALF